MGWRGEGGREGRGEGEGSKIIARPTLPETRQCDHLGIAVHSHLQFKVTGYSLLINYS